MVRNSQVEGALHESEARKNGAPFGTPRPTDERNDLRYFAWLFQKNRFKSVHFRLIVQQHDWNDSE